MVRLVTLATFFVSNDMISNDMISNDILWRYRLPRCRNVL
jgi:hypothetical protein